MLGTVNLVMGSSSAAMATPTQCAAVKSLASSKIGLHNHCRTFSLPLGLASASGSSAFFSSHRGSSLSLRFNTAIAAVNSDQIVSSDSADKEESNKYYFLVANAKFMLDEEEHFKELLFERLRNYGERNKEQDFWLVIEPKFLDKFPNITKRLQRPAVALVSTNSTWITFMKLRLDRVLAESYEANSLEEALASTPTNLEFEKPEKWVAPYSKYEYGWWEAFLPPVAKAEAKV
ncbi:uncharacterized protein LOC111777251 [Cucurbita pepo subsp. pepo]|uniref:Uncharacterized protein LOC111449035 n=1 Tax=Cucurbita moschata TaxID=3662 RepID=A0A6J1FW50_CUCMO|nr:uncharacterized protein LOC111449035 [Cucurbita moschata]XP_023512536.1 uncharacterized protein LOC111777251 [Cucurbita pepo subsp. pepo]XP_023512537.1 uncharacterized protein LOC111777251 [Cucurbita pepo subsp. pepo]